MWKICIFTSLVVLCSNSLGDIQPGPLDGRIIGGKHTTIKAHPYQLSLMYKSHHICGASIISTRWALTAAHCTDKNDPVYMAVRSGSSIIGLAGHVTQIRRTIQHPQFDYNKVDYDLALLEFEDELILSSRRQPIPLIEANATIPEGTKAVVTGWGSTAEGEPFLALLLQEITVPIVNQDTCRTYYNGYSITDRMFCAGYQNGGKDACQGDSGGPLVVDGKLSGVVSWGMGCARPEYPGVYSNISVMRDFVKNVTGI